MNYEYAHSIGAMTFKSLLHHVSLHAASTQILESATSSHISSFFYFIGIQPLGRSGQRPELSQAAGMALVRCILGKFLRVVCHCFPPYPHYTIN
jgi:hypothetical protein